MTDETQKSASGSSRALWIGGLVVVLVLAAVVMVVALTQLQNAAGTTTNTGAAIVDAENYYDGSTVIDPPRELSNFTLTSHTGDPISLSDLRGKVALVYFGYTHCPDVCPITLGEFKQVKQALGAEAEDVAFVMISVDGERDTPERLADYIANFDEAFIGMTGDEQTLRRISEDFDLFFEKHPGENYIVDHTASVFMIDPESRLATIFAYGTEPEVMTEYVREAMS